MFFRVVAVSVELIVIGAVYRVELVVGVAPFVV
jgi:hypothetical protein